MPRPIHLIAIAALAAPFALAHPALARTQTIHGECNYADRFKQLLQSGNYAVALCDSVTIDSGRHGTIQFTMGDPSTGGSWYRFDGAFTDDKMTVSTVQIRGKDPLPATGQCQLVQQSGETAVVTCVAQAGGLTYAGNFQRIQG